MRNKRGRGSWNGPSRGAHGGRGGGGALSFRRPHPNSSAHATDSFLAVANAPSFSMQDEARNTSRDHLKSDGDDRLRDRPVKFISAGLIEPLKEMQSQSPATVPTRPTALEALAAPHNRATPEPPRTEEGPAPTTSSDLYFVDTAGDKSLRSSDVPKPELEPQSHDSGHETDSSEEVLLFKGRSAAPRPAPTTITVHQMQREIEIVARAQAQRLQTKPAPDEQPAPEPSTLPPMAPSSTSEKARVTDRPVSSFDAILQDSDHEDEALKDYMENMEGLEDLMAQHTSFAARDIGGRDGDIVAEGDSDNSSDTDTDNDADSDDEVAGDGDPADVSEDNDSPPPDMDDEEFARLLAKQESLGIHGDGLVLFDEAAAWSIRSPRSRRRGPQAPPKGSKLPDNAVAVADVLDNPDLVMDWNRTNPLRKKPKGKHGTASFDVADENLKAIMEASFEKDRLKKKERKQEREELRAKGLLGKHPNPDDPRVKYVDGINMDELRQEFAIFLITGDQICTLPPMDPSARKIVHEVAIKLRIKSKSTGKGDQRRPVLHRTKATAAYSEDTIDRAFSRAHRRFFPRPDKQRKSRPGGGGGGGGGGRSVGGHAVVRCRDGEVVGGSAPELGETNKGRTMLEKMGWSKGMGLGALDNKGILEPVAHVVKTSRAGLG
ncbi:hypothetical protein RB595_007084 [Gaeumannomyces hyphopodioides]